MDHPTGAGPLPLKVELPAGTHAICTCGRSSNAPLCDGSHRGTGLAPRVETFDKPIRYAWCRCRQSATLPACDGTHRGLTA